MVPKEFEPLKFDSRSIVRLSNNDFSFSLTFYIYIDLVGILQEAGSLLASIWSHLCFGIHDISEVSMFSDL